MRLDHLLSRDRADRRYGFEGPGEASRRGPQASADLDNFRGRQNTNAHGGCLGCGWGEEGRGTPRKASGSGVARRDPRVTEWGNPWSGRTRPSRQGGSQSGELKHLSTRVEKANANPSVAASERGRVQTSDPVQRRWPGIGRVEEEAAIRHRRIPSRPFGSVKPLECGALAGESPVGGSRRRPGSSSRVPRGP